MGQEGEDPARQQEQSLVVPEQSEDEQDGQDSSDRDISLVEILENPEVTKAVNTVVAAWANTRPQEMRLRFWSLYLGIAFSALVLLVVSVLGYLGVLTKEVTGTLLGSLIGYWFGRHQAKRE